MVLIRESVDADGAAILALVNDAAQAYRGVIPVDRWREPYMSTDELEKEISGGIVFWMVEEERRLLGVMGIQDKEMSLWCATRMSRQPYRERAWEQGFCATWKASPASRS